MTYTATEKLEAIERELAFRRRLYPRFVASHKMKEKIAQQQIEIMEAIAADYRERVKSDLLL